MSHERNTLILILNVSLLLDHSSKLRENEFDDFSEVDESSR